MKNKIVRNLVIYITLFQLFSCGTIAKSEKNKKKEFILVDNSNINNPIYQRYDEKTNDYKEISIFDDENINSEQYGADQRVFRDNFNELIKDPIIWNILQKHLPVERFNSEDEALFVYKTHFKNLANNGCGYSTATNYIFRLFEGHEKEFYNTFGYPMYVIKNNNIDFNYEPMMLDFYDFYLFEILKDYKSLELSMQRDLYEFQLKEYKEKYKIIKPKRSFTEEQWKEWYKNGNKIKNEIKKLLIKISEAKNEDLYFGIPFTSKFGYLSQFLKQYGIKIKINCKDKTSKLSIDDIIVNENFTYYQVDENGFITKEHTYYDLHYSYITGINDEYLVLSTWGNKCIYYTSKSRYFPTIKIKRK